MPNAIVKYVHVVDRLNRRIGRLVIWLVLVLLAILLYAGFSKAAFDRSPIWTVELAQFTLTAYYLLGAPYSFQNGAHVRMDLFYSRWAPRKQAIWDCFTILCLVFYLVVTLIGAVDSTVYAIEGGQRRPSAWQPHLWPIRSIMTLGIFLLLLQAISQLFKDIALARGKPIA